MSHAYNPQSDGDRWTAQKHKEITDALGVIDNVGLYPAQAASYIIFKEGSVYYRRNGLTGEVDDSGADAATVIRAAIDVLAEGIIELKPMSIDIGSSVISIVDKHIVFKGAGRESTIITGSGPYILKCEKTVGTDVRMGVEGVKLRQTNDDGDCLILRGVAWNHFEDILTSGGRRGLSLEGAIGNTFEDIYVWGAKAAFQEPLVGGGLFLTSYGGKWSNSNVFTKCRVASCVGDGLVGTFAQYNKFIGCDFSLNRIGFRGYTTFEGTNFDTCWFEANSEMAAYITATGTTRTKIKNSMISHDGSSHSVYVLGPEIVLEDNRFMGDATTYLRIGAGISNPETIIIARNKGLTATKISDLSGAKYIDNPDYITENSGTATITAAATSIATAHGCNYTPAAADIDVKLTNLPTNDIGDVYVNTIGAANFTINCRNVPGAATAIFAWTVRKV